MPGREGRERKLIIKEELVCHFYFCPWGLVTLRSATSVNNGVVRSKVAIGFFKKMVLIHPHALGSESGEILHGLEPPPILDSVAFLIIDTKLT